MALRKQRLKNKKFLPGLEDSMPLQRFSFYLGYLEQRCLI